jgi:hypothetical protein
MMSLMETALATCFRLAIERKMATSPVCLTERLSMLATQLCC